MYLLVDGNVISTLRLQTFFGDVFDADSRFLISRTRRRNTRRDHLASQVFFLPSFAAESIAKESAILLAFDPDEMGESNKLILFAEARDFICFEFPSIMIRLHKKL